ncbi:MAG: hypothetical protein AAGA32_21680, partial [Pseudomonadota bacterium]
MSGPNKAGVAKACFYEPKVNRTYADLAAHDDTARAIVLGPMADQWLALGIVRLAKPHGRAALEAACKRALEIGGTSYSSVNSILKNT